MTNKTIEQAKKEMAKYNKTDFELYVSEAGWESWMEEYTEVKDGEEYTEIEWKAIVEKQKEMWAEVHGI